MASIFGFLHRASSFGNTDGGFVVLADGPGAGLLPEPEPEPLLLPADFLPYNA